MKRKITWGLTWALALAILAELVLPMGVGDYMPWWHHTTGFFAVYGVAGCVLLVFVTKLVGRLGLQKPEPPPEQEEAAPLDPAEEEVRP